MAPSSPLLPPSKIKEGSDVIRIFYRLLFVLFLIAGSLRMAAQSSIAAWVIDAELAESIVVDDGDSLEFDFEESVGYGVSFNHFWTANFSTEAALQSYDATMTLDPPGGSTFDVGEADITTITFMAQWHFNRDGRFSPYVGGGVAHISGEFDFADDIEGEPGDPDTVGLESDVTGTAAVGANVRLTDRVFLTGEIKVIPWDLNEEDGDPEDAIEANPGTFSVGIRFVF
jgi:outer membrane protein W